MKHHALTTIKDTMNGETQTILFKNVRDRWDINQQATEFIRNMGRKPNEFAIVKIEEIAKDDWTLEEVEEAIFMLDMIDRWSSENYEESRQLHNIRRTLMNKGA